MTPPGVPRNWALALGGLFLFTLATFALSSPGRMDIIDGQARYLAARGLVEHGDPAIRDTDFSFVVLPGRDGKRYSMYRLPPILAGVPAIWLADATGSGGEPRREFFFTLVNAAVGAALVVAYAVWFRGTGGSPRAAVGWALAGAFCTPVWYYSTSTFDDVLGGAFVVAALAAAWLGRHSRPLAGAAVAGLLLGLAFNAKPPLGIFVLPLLAVALTGDRPGRSRLAGAALVVGGLAIGLAVYQGYEWYKFPPGTTGDHERLLKEYARAWPGNTLAGLCGLLVSPSAGVLWYCPPVLLGLTGLAGWPAPRAVRAAVALACVVFLVFIATLSFFKGDGAWGPRYVTPLYAALWLFAPAGAAVTPRRLVALLLSLGLLSQLLGLSVDGMRVFVEYRLFSGFFSGKEWVHFHPAFNQLAHRPREILDIWNDDGSATTAFSPSSSPTSSDVFVEDALEGPAGLRAYRIYASFRPWWSSYRWLPPAERPVALLPTAGLLLALAGGGLALAAWGLRPAGRLTTAGPDLELLAARIQPRQ